MVVAPVRPEVASSVREFVAKPRRMLIDNEWVEAASGKVFDVLDPATEQVIAQVAEGEAEDIDRAVKAARAAFESGPWPNMTPDDRARLLWRIADLIDANADELAQLETLDNGKPVAVAKAVDVNSSAAMFRYFAGWTTKLEGNVIPMSNPKIQYHAYTRHEPIGVAGQIIPWNFPLMMAAWKLAPALACGVTIVLKPAEQTPLSALRLGELLLEAGLPKGVVNVVTGYGETAGAALAAHPGVDKVAFTGSTEVGKLIVQAAAGNLKKVSLELGGKSPNIVFDDADPETLVPGVADAIFFNTGQCCTAGSRLYVQKSQFDKVAQGVADLAEKIKVGNGFAADTQLGPVVSQEQLDRVTGYLKSGFEDGARALSGGGRAGDSGYFVQPTVLVDANPSMKVVREEIFGPVVLVQPFDDLDDLIRQANDTTYGLAAGIWTTDVRKAHAVAAKLRAGTVWVNCYNVGDPALPFGGYKESGWGREMGHNALELYTEVKSVVIQL